MSQTSSRVGWNGGLGGWAEGQCRGFMDFALFIHSAQYAEYRYCALRPYSLLFLPIMCNTLDSYYALPPFLFYLSQKTPLWLASIIVFLLRSNSRASYVEGGLKGMTGNINN